MSISYNFILICLLLNNVATAKVLPPAQQTSSNFLAKLSDVMRQEWSTAVIFSNNRHFASDTTTTFISLLYPCPVVVTNGKNPMINPHIAKRPNYIFIFAETVEEITKHLKQSNAYKLWNVRAYIHFIICRPVGDRLWLNSTAKQIWKNRILHFLIYYHHHKNLEVITYNPFFDEMNNLTKSEKRKIYENKFRDMNGYPLRIGFLSDPPRIVQKDGVYYGIDAMIMRGFGKKLKASIDIVGPGYANTVDEKYGKHFLQVRRRKVDFGFVSCFAVEEEEPDVAFSYPRRMDGVVVLIPHASPITQFHYMFMVFNKLVWILIGISLLAVTFCKFLLLRLLNIPTEISKSSLENWATIFGVSIATLQRNFPIRTLFLIWAYSCFTLNIHFQSLLTSYLITPKFGHNLETLAELKRNNTIILINRHNVRGIAGQYPKHLVRSLSEHKITKLITNGSTSYAYAMQSSTAELFSWKKSENGQPVYHIIKELLIPAYTTYLLPSDSPYLDEVNK